jgi:tetrahydrodipicolinate N-succinyltransferase
LAAGIDADVDLAACIDAAGHVEGRIVVKDLAVGDPQRVAVGTVATAVICYDQDAPCAVERRCSDGVR